MHTHACDFGHNWMCNGTAIRSSNLEPSVCICFDHRVPMEEGDHGECTIEVLTCPEHRAQQIKNPGVRPTIDPDLLEKGFIPLQWPEDVEELLKQWGHDPEPSIGLCLLCGNSIRSEQDLIQGTTTHNCTEGCELEAKIAKRKFPERQ